MKPIATRDLIRRMTSAGFAPIPGNGTGHVYFERYGHKIALPAPEREKTLSLTLVKRLKIQLAKAGFEL